jgi:hypothetical protein
MRYTAYDTFIDYLFSNDSKSLTYNDLQVFLTSAGTSAVFQPRDRDDGSITMSEIRRYLIPSGSFTYPAARVDWRPAVSDSNAMDSETDKTYEEVLNIPASANLDRASKYVDSFVQKAEWNAMLHGFERDQYSSEAELLGTEIPFSSAFKEEEYDSYGIPMTFLNGDSPSVTADQVTMSGDRITMASGCLIAVQKSRRSDGAECLFPLGFIDFESPIPSTRYEVKFDPQGFLQLK